MLPLPASSVPDDAEEKKKKNILGLGTRTPKLVMQVAPRDKRCWMGRPKPVPRAGGLHGSRPRPRAISTTDAGKAHFRIVSEERGFLTRHTRPAAVHADKVLAQVQTADDSAGTSTCRDPSTASSLVYRGPGGGFLQGPLCCPRKRASTKYAVRSGSQDRPSLPLFFFLFFLSLTSCSPSSMPPSHVKFVSGRKHGGCNKLPPVSSRSGSCCSPIHAGQKACSGFFSFVVGGLLSKNSISLHG